MNYEKKNTRYITVPDWGRHHPWPPVGGLRHLIYNAKTNGFHKVIKRVGGTVLIDEKAFFEWVESQEAKSAKEEAEKL